MSEEPDTAYFLADENSVRFIEDEEDADIYVLGGSEEYRSFSIVDVEGKKKWADYDSFREEVLSSERRLKYGSFVVEESEEDDLKESIDHFLGLWGAESTSLKK
ncbi:MAG: hypothetical protein ABEK16_02830 [Candidatus Nanohalobium sp.]